MTEDGYRTLTEVCDEILLARESNIERIGVGWLHVLSEHPYNLTQYAELFQDKPPQWRTRLRRLAGKVLHRIRTIHDGGQWFYGDTLPSTADVLFVSHFLNEAQA